MRTAVTTSTEALLASFEVSYVIAKKYDASYHRRDIIASCSHEMCEIMKGANYGEVLKTIPPSNNTVMRRIESMSEHIKEQLLTRIKCSPIFALQID
jgi:hypothetical protein